LEGILEKQRYLAGDVLTEADIRLFVTLIRFDEVRHSHMLYSISLIKRDYLHIQ
jgi:putative glutathione S-transferase